MKKALLLVLALIAIVPVAVEAQQDLAELVQQGDTYLKAGLIRRNNLRPHTGDVISYVPGRCGPRDRLDDGGCRSLATEPKSQVRTRGSLRNGKWHGLYESYSGSRVTAQGDYNMGQRCGIWTLETLPSSTFPWDTWLDNDGLSFVTSQERYPPC